MLELFLDSTSVKIVYTVFFALILWVILQMLTRAFVTRIVEGSPRGRRLRTVTSVVRTLISTVLVVIVGFQVLGLLGLNIAPLLASAGVVGLAIGFGAQTLVKDVISGFFLLSEDQFDEGDEVEISSKRGIVEKITLRTIWIREKNGVIHIIPAGTINLVSNYSRVKDAQKGKDK